MSFLFKKVLAVAQTPSSFEKDLGKNFFQYSSSGTTVTTIFTVLQSTLNFLYSLSYFVSIFFIVYAGLQFALSAGDKSKAETAKTTLQNAVLSMVALLFLNLTINFLIEFFGGANNYINPLPTIFQTTP